MRCLFKMVDMMLDTQEFGPKAWIAWYMMMSFRQKKHQISSFYIKFILAKRLNTRYRMRTKTSCVQ